MRSTLLTLTLVAAACGGSTGEAERSAGDEVGSSGASSDPSRAIRLADDAGRTVILERAPERIVSLVPSATEILLSLGAGGTLVGRTDFDTVPPLDTLPSVGGGLEPSLERLVSLRPDLVVRFAASSDRTTPERLDAMGIPHLAVRPDGIEDVRRIIRLLGRAVERSRAADSLVAEIDTTLARVADRVRSRPRRAVAFVLGGSPPWVAGPETFIDELLAVAGGRNVFGDLEELYGPVSPEAFVSREIELVVAVEGTDVQLPEGDFPVRRISADIQTPGPDLGEAARELACLLHPGAFR